jgi:fibronectin type 3 domain-containing protein
MRKQAVWLLPLLLALMFAAALPNTAAPANAQSADGGQFLAPQQFGPGGGGMIVGRDYKHDVSPPLRDIPPARIPPRPNHEANPPRSTGLGHANAADPVVQNTLAPLAMPTTLLNFNGIPFPGVSCNCAPPDTNGEAGATQYVQIVNEGYQVFNKSNGASQLGPVSIATIWNGFGGVCQNNGDGDPVLLYDQLANRWLVSQFAGSSVPTDECIAVSTSSDATGSYNRYGFHLGTNFFDYPHLGVWPDAYYMSMNVFNSSGTLYLGPQPFAFDRAKMLAGQSATYISPAGPLGGSVDPILPSDLDGSALPPAGAPNSFVGFPGGGRYTTYHFHVDFATPSNSTWTTFASPAAAGFTQLCTTTRSCVPQLGTTSKLDAIADRLMFRLAYRNFGDHESVVGNYTVSSGGVAGIRWFELRNVTSGPEAVSQESTYQPDTTWRWMGSAAMDHSGDIALGFSASSGSIYPQIRYAGRLAGDPINVLAQGETHLFDGTGSQTGTSSRWGDYSDITVDPVDDCTFWYTTEYYATTGSFNWRTRIGSFKFSSCGSAATVPGAPTLSASAGDAVVHLTWTVPSDGGSPITNYKVYRGTTSGGETLLTTVGNVSSFDDTAVTNGNTYYYQVSAVNGVGEGSPSNEVSATPQAGGAGVPSAPQNLTAGPAKGKGVQLSWSPPSTDGGSPITGYNIYRGTASGGEALLTSVGNVTSYKDTSTSRGATYYYYVTAVNAVGEGPKSNEASAKAK